ncbi:MAG TPA: hypothetical protein VJW93_05915 [Candidatus Acidoferrales bacterium]|nr:hypothetical protein [Candidatus Acidoferrales bacterium]
MRIGWRISSVAAFVLVAWFASVRVAAAQDEVLMPEQSAAKAKGIIQQAVDALGGQMYLNVHDITCTGQLSQFGHSGDLNGFAKFIDYEQPPLKDRQENMPKRNLINVFNGDKGWVLDRGGVSEAATSDVARFQEDVKIDIDNILRHRVHESNMIFRYAGPDVVDLKEADWIEIIDNENRTIRIAFARSTHLPIRKTVDIRDPSTQLKSQEVEYYSLYHPIDGVQTAFQITRERNGFKVYQVFFDKCQYNTNVPDSLFTKESLDDRWDKIGKKDKKKQDKSSTKADKD